MRVLELAAKQINGKTLTQELISAGVPMREPPAIRELGDDISRTSLTLAVVINTPEENEDFDALASQVAEAHTPDPEPTPAQNKRRQARKLIESDNTPESIRLRAVIRVLYGSLVETRTWCNQMRQQLQAAGMLTPPRLQKRTWEEAMQAVLNQIDAEIPE